MDGFYHEQESDSSLNIISTTKMDRGLAYGEACFETFRVINGAIFRWPEHVQRLQRGLATFDLRLNDDEITKIHQACLSQASGCADDTLLRLTVSGGSAAWGINTKAASLNVYIQAMPCCEQTSSLQLQIKPWPFPRKEKPAKFSADYAEVLRVLNDCADANVLFTADGQLLSAATANLLLFRQGRWWTPILQAGLLPGVVRHFLLDRDIIEQAAISIDWLADCEALALCNSGLFIRAVERADERQLNARHPALAQLFDAFIGEPGVPGRLFEA